MFLKDRIYKIFEDTLRSSDSIYMNSEGTWSPSVDIYETESEFIVNVEVPEVKENDVSIRLESNILTIEGERRIKRDKIEDYYRIERPYGRFKRSFVLPDLIDSNSIRATLHNGVLNIVLPKNR